MFTFLVVLIVITGICIIVMQNTFRWKVILTVASAIVLAIILSGLMSYWSDLAGIIGFLLGAIIGALIPQFLAVLWNWLTLPWKILLILFIIAGIMSAF